MLTHHQMEVGFGGEHQPRGGVPQVMGPDPFEAGDSARLQHSTAEARHAETATLRVGEDDKFSPDQEAGGS